MDKPLSTVSIYDIEKVLNKIKKDLPNKNTKDIPITFEFLVANFYPDVYNNIMDQIKNSYTKGYIQAKSEI